MLAALRKEFGFPETLLRPEVAVQQINVFGEPPLTDEALDRCSGVLSVPQPVPDS